MPTFSNVGEKEITRAIAEMFYETFID